jgi:hypothetical protein
MRRIYIDIAEGDARHVSAALTETVNGWRSAKRRPRGMTIGELTDRIVACNIAIEKIDRAIESEETSPRVMLGEPRPSRGDV